MVDCVARVMPILMDEERDRDNGSQLSKDDGMIPISTSLVTVSPIEVQLINTLQLERG